MYSCIYAVDSGTRAGRRVESGMHKTCERRANRPAAGIKALLSLAAEDGAAHPHG